MNYKLELVTQDSNSNIIFNNILLDTFKINIVERYNTKVGSNAKLCEVLFKVRSLQDEILKKKDGNLNTYIRNDEFAKYQKLIKVLYSPHYKKKLINRKEAEQDFVHFILSLVILNYELT
ncbi:prevent-host-death protein [Epilithonimonas sp. UC225_85]|uniref:prevent-host-death protein n=1 Tax=Epilithonimonas sp. UC225_85 TaxID=3350167 RepID=UPI0036D248D8